MEHFSSTNILIPLSGKRPYSTKRRLMTGNTIGVKTYLQMKLNTSTIKYYYETLVWNRSNNYNVDVFLT